MLKPYRIHLAETISLAIPVVIGQLGTTLMGQVDSAMIGATGHVPLAASTLANSIYFIITVIPIGAILAIAPLVSEAMGGNKEEEAGKVMGQGLWVSIVLGLASGLVTYLLSYLMPYLGQPEEEVTLMIPYLKIFSISTVPLIVFLAYKQFCDGISDTVPGAAITFLGLFINIFFNYLLIYGYFGFPALGLVGAGIATLIGRLVMAAVIIYYVHQAKSYKKFNLNLSVYKFEPERFKKMLSLGLPMGFQFFFEVAAFGGTTIMVGYLIEPSITRAAHQIALGSASLTFMVATGIAAAAGIRVGNFKGSLDMPNLRRAGMVGLGIVVGFMGLISLIFIVFRHQLPLIFQVTEPKVLLIAANLFIIAAAFQLFDGLQAVASGILRSMQDVKFPAWIAFFAYWIVSLPLSYFLAFTLNFHIYGIWYSYVVSLSIVAVLLTWRFFKKSKESL